MKRKTKFIIVLIVIAVIITVIYFIIWSMFFSAHSGSRTLNRENNTIDFSIDTNYRYIHLTVEAGEGVTYKILNPNEEVIEEGKSNGVIDYYGDSEKGNWKVVLGINEECMINFHVWAGNLKSREENSLE